jgi:cytochrome c1
MKWRRKEFFISIFASTDRHMDKVVDFLNSISEEKALEAKVIMSSTGLVYVLYRSE